MSREPVLISLQPSDVRLQSQLERATQTTAQNTQPFTQTSPFQTPILEHLNTPFPDYDDSNRSVLPSQESNRFKRRVRAVGEHVKFRRTRNGCYTCRSRRVKCDETRPICERCRKGNRECIYPESPSGKARRNSDLDKFIIDNDDAPISAVNEPESATSNNASVTRSRSCSSSSHESYFGQSDPRISSITKREIVKKTVSFSEEATLHTWEQVDSKEYEEKVKEQSKSEPESEDDMVDKLGNDFERSSYDETDVRRILSLPDQVLDSSLYTRNGVVSQEAVDNMHGSLRNHDFRWEHPGAEEVFVTGTFDDWAKTQKLDRHGNGADAIFFKRVSVPAKEDVHYKFVVDGYWTLDPRLPTVTDSNDNVNNVLRASETEQYDPQNRTQSPRPEPYSQNGPLGIYQNPILSEIEEIEPLLSLDPTWPHLRNDSDSETSYSVRSMESMPYTKSSMTSYALPSLANLFIQEFCGLLIQDSTLRSVCLTALENDIVPRERLQRNLRRCLKAFATNLREESSVQQYAVAGFILRNANRVSSEFLSMLRPLDPGRKFQLPKLREDKRKTMESFLKQLPSAPVLDPETLESLEKGGESDSDDQSLSDGAPEDDLPHLAGAKEFMTQSSSFKQLQVDVKEFLYPTFESKLRTLIRNFSVEELQVAFSYDLAHLTAELREVDPRGIQILEPKDIDSGIRWLQLAKERVENLSGVVWDWWPLAPHQRIPKADERSLQWNCACGDLRHFIVPVKFAKKLQHIINDTTGIRERAAGTSNQKPQSTKLNFTNEAGSGTPESGRGQYGSPTNTGDHPLNASSATPTSSATQIHQPKSLHILLVVAAGNDFELSQIEVNGRKCNDFFRRLRKEYETLRGFWRNWFSIWRYSHCDFYRCDKFDNQEFAPTKSNDYPALGDRNYDYKPRPINTMPPVSRHEFFARFYACLDATSLRHRLMHKLTGKCKRLGLHNHDRLQLFPKRLSKFEEKGDEPGMFWGIYARERPALRYIVLYNVFCLLSPLLYFFLRMTVLGKTHDLQDAGVPFAMVTGALSVFWSVFFGSLQDNQVMKLD